MAKLQREKLSNQIYAVLKEMIADHRFLPGARLNIESIARELDVSRTPVWEAVRRLEQEGLVEDIHNRGVFMSYLTAEKALDLYAVREVLEGMAARLAAGRIDDGSSKKCPNASKSREKRSRAGMSWLIQSWTLNFMPSYMTPAATSGSRNSSIPSRIRCAP